jgi:hypothetical protein
MNTRFVVALSGLLIIGSAVFAQQGDGDHAKKEEHMKAMKEETIKEVDAQIASLQKFRACVSSANDHAAMKACHEQREADMKSLREAKRKERLARIEEEQKRLEQEKQQLQNPAPDKK